MGAGEHISRQHQSGAQCVRESECSFVSKFKYLGFTSLQWQCLSWPPSLSGVIDWHSDRAGMFLSGLPFPPLNTKAVLPSFKQFFFFSYLYSFRQVRGQSKVLSESCSLITSLKSVCHKAHFWVGKLWFPSIGSQYSEMPALSK